MNRAPLRRPQPPAARRRVRAGPRAAGPPPGRTGRHRAEKLAQSQGFGGSRAYHEVLVHVVTDLGGKGLPESGRGTAAKWKTWLDPNRSLFSKKFAKM